MRQLSKTSQITSRAGHKPRRSTRRAYGRMGGLRAKIIAWFLVPTALILTSVALLVVTASQRVTEELVFERDVDRTQLLAHQLSVELAAYPQALTVMMTTMAHAPDDLQSILEAHWPVGSLDLFDGGVLVVGADGIITAATRGLHGVVGQSFALPASEPESLGFTDVNVDAMAGMDVILARPLLIEADADSPGHLVGVIRAERTATRGSTFYRRIWDLYIGRRFSAEAAETAYLVDGAGRVIFHPDTFLIGEDFSDHEAVQQALTGAMGAIRTRNLAGDDVVAGFVPIPRTSWALVTEEAWTRIARTSDPYLRLMVGLLMLGVVAPVVTVALGVGRITRPLETMTQAARDLADGNFDGRIEVDTGDELETLGDQFNAMAAELRASYATLEQRVADRTQELATLNTIAAVVSRSLQLDAIMGAALEATLAAVGIEAGAAFRLQAERLDLVAHRGFSQSFVEQVTSLPLDSSLAAEAAVTLQPMVRSVSAYPEGRLRRLLEEEGAIIVISVPLIAKDAVRGVLNLVTFRARDLTPEATALLAAIGRQVGLAVENACLYEQAESVAATAERHRLARDLHDAISQTLFTASLLADVIPQLWVSNPAEAQRQLALLRRLTRGAQAEMRTLLLELRPAALVDAGLETLLGHLARAAAARADVEVRLDVTQIPVLPVDVKIALYRIVQEAVNNVIKHAQAERVTLTAHAGAAGGGIEIHICDDGVGFDLDSVPGDHFGLLNMRERATAVDAALTVESAPGKGTCVSVVW